MGPSMSSNIGMLTTIAAMMAPVSSVNNYTRRRWSDGNGMGDGQHAKGVFIEPEKKMQPFFIKGEKIIAGCRRDAIKIYNRKFGAKR
jgi:hypothetical protein